MDIRKTDTYKQLAEKFGLRMTLDQIAEFKGVDRRTVQNQIYQGLLEFPVYKEGAQWYADTRAVAEYVESKYRESCERFGATMIIPVFGRESKILRVEQIDAAKKGA